MDAVEYYQDYIAHFGVPGQKKGIRNFQSYETAPTRSGMVGEERGEAAKQAERLTKEEKQEAKAEEWRNRQAEKINRFYNIENVKAKRDIEKAKAAGKEDMVQLNTDILKNNDVYRKKELNYVKNMSIKDIKKEKTAVALTELAIIGLDVGAVFGAAMFMPMPIAPVVIPDHESITRTRRRNKIREQEEAARRS